MIKGSMWAPGGRWDRVRRELIGYYFLAGRSWLTPDQMAALRVEVEAIRKVSRRERGIREPAAASGPTPLSDAERLIVEAFPGTEVAP